MPQPVRQILPGVLHWTALHPRWGQDVSSYLLTETRVLIDPLLPPEGLEWFADSDLEPREILLSSRHHLRDAPALAERYGCAIHAPAAGMHEFPAALGVRPYAPGTALPGGVVGYEVGALSPDESVLHVPDAQALVVADGVVSGADGLEFMPDECMDDPPATREALRAAYRRLTDELDFEHLLCTHGDPVLATGRSELREFAAPIA